ncbi:MAG: Crp/Fnr family transcriptional regulator [Ktedonobacterales bacterium]
MSRKHLFGFPITRRAHDAVSSGSRLQQKREYLRKQDIFHDLPPEHLDVIEHQTRMVTCPKGRVLYSQEDRAEALFLLKRGRVQLYRLAPSGKRLELATLEPGTFFGEMPLLGESLRHAFAEAVDDALVCVMSRGDVERLIREQPTVALNMLEAISRRLALSEARLEELAYRSVEARIAAVLLRLGQGCDCDSIVITHQELGDMVGALRETVTKTLDGFQAQDVVQLGRGRIHLRDMAGLRAALEH